MIQPKNNRKSLRPGSRLHVWLLAFCACVFWAAPAFGLGTPTGVTGTTSAATQAILSWSSVATATSYKVYRGTTSGGETSLATGIAGTSYNDTTATRGTTYYYTVYAVNGGTTSSASSEVIVDPVKTSSPYYQINANGPAAAPFAADAYYTPSTAYSVTATINVAAPNSAPMAVYQSERNSVGGTNAGGPVTYTLPGLTPAGTYVVRLHFSDNVFYYSGGRKFNVAINGTSVLSQFDVWAAANAINKSVVRNFNATADAGGKITIVFSNGSADQLMIQGIEVLSGSVTAAPTGLAAVMSAATSASVTWGTVTGATSYNLYRSTSAGTEGSTPYQTGLSSTSYTDTGLTPGTTYYYKVVAVNAQGESALSSEASWTPLPAPTGVAATVGNAQVALAWTAPTGATSYKVFRSTTTGGSYTQIGTPSSASYTDSTAANNTLYYYVVQAVNATATSGNSAEASAIPGGANGLLGWWKLDDNTGTTASDSSGFSNTSTFTSAGWVTGRSGYAGNLNGSSSVIDAGKSLIATTNSYSVACWVKLNGAGSYHETLISQDGTSISSFFLQYRSEASGFGLQMENADSTSSYGPLAASTTTVAFGTWYHLIGVYDAVNGQAKLYVNGNLESTQAFSNPFSATGHTVIGRGLYNGSQVDPLNGYIDDVRVYNRLLTAAEIATISAYPTSVTASMASTTSATISWAAFPSATSYNLYRSTSAGTEGGTPLLTGLTGTSYTNTGLTSGTTYYYKISATTASGESAHSDEVSITPLTAPTGVAATPGNAQVALAWTATTGATSYKVFRSTTTGGSYTQIGTPSSASYTDSTAANNTTYYYVVQAVNATATSANSSEMAATPGGSSGLLGWWKLDNNTGTSVSDSSGFSNTGTFTSAGWATGRNGYAGSFNGSSSFVDAGKGVTTTANSFSAACWVKLATTISNNQTFISQDGVNASNFFLQYNSGTAKFAFQMENADVTSAGGPTATSTTAPVAGTWYHVLGVYDAPNSQIKLYVNGSLQATQSITTPWSATGHTVIGRGLYNGSPCDWVNGLIDDARVYNRLLTAAEIATISAYPTSVTATQASTTSATISWAAFPSATSYNLYRSTTAGGEGATPVQTGLTGTSYTDTGLTTGTTYYYKLSATTASGESAHSDEVSLTPLTAPTGVVATPGNAQVALTWTATTGATSYKILRGTTTGGSYTQIGTPSSASYTDSTAANNTTYYYVVQAVNATATSANSSEVAATPGGASGLLGWYKLDENTGTTANDGSGFANTGTFTSAGWATGRNGYAGSFNGSSSVVDAGKGVIATANSFSVACWVKMNSLPGYPVFMSQDGVNNSGFYLQRRDDTGAFRMMILNSDVSTSNTSANSTTIPVTGVWYHLIGVYDAVNSQVKLYVNGSLQDTQPFTTPWSATGDTVIGRAKYQGGLSYWVNGLIDDARVYNRLLTAAEIATISAYPTSVTAAQASATSATLSWAAFPNATSYNLYRSTSAGTEGGTPIATGLTGTSYTNTGLTSGTTYYYKLSATTASGESAHSDEVSLTPVATPTGLAVTEASATSAALTWTAVTGATSYKLYRSTTSNGQGSTPVQTGLTGTSYTDTGLTTNTAYYYKLTAVTATSESSQSSEVTITPIAIPTNLAVSQASATSSTLTWTAVTGATSYKLYRSTTSNGQGSTPVQTGLTGTSYTDTGLTSGTTYYYKLTAVNATAESPQSTEVSVTPLSAPTGVAGTTSAATPGIISWSAVTGATSYTVYRGTSSGGETSLATGVTGTSYNDTTATRGTTYYYTVAAVNAGGTSSQSSEVIVDPVNTSSPYFQINATGPAVAPFAADAYYNVPAGYTGGTGSTITVTAPNSAPQAVYQSERNSVGNSNAGSPVTYTLPGLTANGTYVVRLHFSESYWSSAGNRKFNVSINGTSVLTNFDVWAAANAGKKSVVRNFNVTADASGNIAIVFSNGTNDQLEINGIEVLGGSVTAAPTGLAAAQSLATSVALTWTAVTGAISYNLYRSTSAGTEGSTPYQTGLSGTSYTDTGVTAGTTYYYKLVAVNAQGESALSSEVSLAPLAAPTGLAVAQASATSSTLTWTAVTGATSYSLYRSTTAGGEGATPVQTGLTGTSYTNTGLTSGTTYYYKLTAVATGKESAQSSEVSLTPLAAPTGLAVTEASATSSTLTWTAVTGATSYSLYRSTTAGGEGSTPYQTGLTGTSYTDTGLTTGTTYYYKLTAVTATSESSQSSEVTITPIAVPTGLAVSQASATSSTLTWTAVTGATSYRLYRSTTSNGEGATPVQTGLTGMSYTDTGLTSGTTYYYKLTAVNATAESPQSTEVSVTPVAAPTGLAVAQASATSSTLTWTAVTGATSYSLYRSTTAGGEGSTPVQTGLTGTSYTNTGLTNGTTYYYKLTAVTTTSESAQSSEVTYVPLAVPTGLAVTQASATSATLTWTAVTGATSYSLYRSTTAGGEGATPVQTGLTGTSYTNTGLTSGTTYYYKLTAVNAVAETAQSSEVSLTPLITPTGLAVTEASATSSTLTWTAVTGATSYNLYRSTTAGGEGSTPYQTGLTGTSYTNTGLTTGTTYYYKLTAVTATSESAQSSEVTITPIAVPTGLAVSQASATSSTLTWTAVTGATSYKLYRSTTSNGQGSTPVQTGLTGTSYTDTGLTSGTTYYYKLTAVNATAESPQSTEVSLTPLSAPTGVAGTTSAATPGIISWSAVTGATSYTIYRGTSSGGETSLATGVTGTSYNDTTATRGTTYFYTVVAVNTGASSAQSSEVSVDPVNTASPYYQINVNGPAVSPFAADAYYSAGALTASDGTAVNVTAPNAAPQAVYQTVRGAPNPSTPITYTLPGLTANGSYVVRLHMLENFWGGAGQRQFNVAINGTTVLTNFDIYAAANATYKAVVRNFNVTADASGNIAIVFSYGSVDRPIISGLEVLSGTVTAAPTGLAATQSLATSVLLTWGSVTGATSYNLYRSTSAGTEGSTPYQIGLASASYTDTSVTAGTTYYYKVVAVNAQGESALSSEVSLAPLAAPTGLALSQASATSSTITWTAVTGATSYSLYRSTTAGGEGSTPIQTGLTGTSYTNTGLTSGTTYYYKLTAVATSKESAQSSEVSLTPVAVPTGLAVTEASATSSTLTWTAVTGATSYNLYRSTTAGGEGSTPVQTGLTGTSYTNTGLTSGTTYYYKLTAVNATAESPQSSEVSLTPLAVPTGVAATPGNAQVALTWTATTGATSYKVLRGTTPGSETSLATGVATTSYTDATAANNTTYFYVVQAVNATATSASSSEVAATPGGANGLLGWWKLDENTGTTANDLSGFSNTGTFTSAGWATGRNGYAGNFNGSSSVIDTGKSILATANSFSVACWVKMTSASGSQDFISQDATNNSGFYLQQNGGNGKFNLVMFTDDNQSGFASVYSTSAPVAGTWYHLIAMYDAVNAQIKLYVNGTLQGTSAFSSPWSATGHTIIGRAHLVGSNFGYANSLIDDVRVYNRVLTAAEIATISAYPTSVTATQASATSATIAWTAFPSATSYNLYRSTTLGGEGGTAIATGLTGTSYTNTALTSGTTYYYKLSATTASGESAQSDEVSLTPVATPTGLAVTEASATSAALTWTAVTGATSYKLYRSTTSNGQGSTPVQTGLTGTSYTDTGLTTNTAYYYKLTAVTATSESSQSSEVTITPIAIPTNLAVSQASATSSTLTWTAVTGATSYKLYRSTTSNGEGATPVQTGLTGTSYTDTGLTSGTTYYYKLTAVNATAESPQSTEVSLTPLSAPTGVAGTTSAATPGIISWSAVTGATSYTIYRGTSSGGETSLATGVTGTSYNDTTATRGTTYFYTVVAVNTGASSAQSSEVSVDPVNTSSPYYQINAGGPAVAPFAADAYYVNPGGSLGLYGSAITVTAPNAAPQAVYQTDQYSAANGTFTYTLPGLTANGTYVVRLHLSENFWTAASQRKFNVAINGTTVLTNFDIWAAANAAHKAVVRNFNATADGSGNLTVVFSCGTNDRPDINGLEVLGGSVTAAPTGLAAAQSLATSVALTWTAVTGATSYNLYRSTSAGTEGSTPVQTGLSGTSYTDTGVTAGTTYYYKLVAVNAQGESALSSEVSLAPLAAPTGLALSQASATSSTITWTAVTGATSYSLYRSTSSGGEGATPVQTGLTGTSYTNTGLTSGTTYYYKLTAVTGSAESAQSSEVTITPIAIPTGLAAVQASATSSTLTWTAVTGATSYSLYRSTTAGGEGSTPVQTGLTGTSYTNTGLTTGTTYYYKLTAVTATSESSQSSEVSLTPVATPTGLAVTEASATSSTVTWTAVTGATSYNLYRSTSSNGEGSTPVQTGLTGTSYTDTGLTTGTTYYYKLTAVTATSESTQSSEVSLTPLATPTGLAVTEASATSSTLTWTAVTGATGYNLYRSTTAGGEGSTPVQTGLTGTSYTNTGLTTGTTYYYKLTAVTGSAESAQSSEVTITPIAIPTGLAAAQASATSSTLTWTAVTGATSYSLYRSTTSNGEGSTPIQTGLTGTSYTNTGLTSGTTYYYKLTAVNATAESPQSTEVSLAPVAAPTGLAGTPGNAQVALTWTATTGATSYNVLRGTTTGGAYTQIGTSTSAGYTDSTAVNNTTYYYVIQAVNGGATSANSAEVAVTPAVPTLLLIKRITAINGVSVSGFVSDGAGKDTNTYWPSPSSTYLRGSLTTTAKPGDTVEYTIYFLVVGSGNVTSVVVSNILPDHVNFAATAYNSLTPTDGGSGNSGLALALNAAAYPSAPTVYLSNAADGDRGTYYAAGVAVPGICTTGQNINGVIVVNVVTSPTTLPAATSASSPYNSYGFVRYKVTIR